MSKKSPLRTINGKKARLQGAGFTSKKAAKMTAERGKKSGRWSHYRIVKTEKGYQRIVADRVAVNMHKMVAKAKAKKKRK